MTNDTKSSDYDRGFALGKVTKEMREAGDNPDIRFSLADEARYNRAGFDEFMRGVNDAFKED